MKRYKVSAKSMRRFATSAHSAHFVTIFSDTFETESYLMIVCDMNIHPLWNGHYFPKLSFKVKYDLFEFVFHLKDIGCLNGDGCLQSFGMVFHKGSDGLPVCEKYIPSSFVLKSLKNSFKIKIHLQYLF